MKSVISPISLCLYIHLRFFMHFFGLFLFVWYHTFFEWNDFEVVCTCTSMHAFYTLVKSFTQIVFLFLLPLWQWFCIFVYLLFLLFFILFSFCFGHFSIVISWGEHCKMFQLWSRMWQKKQENKIIQISSISQNSKVFKKPSSSPYWSNKSHKIGNFVNSILVIDIYQV